MSLSTTNRLTGKWALVTGSSGGIGAAIARELGAAGANLIIHGNRHAEQAEKLAYELRRQQATVKVVLCDLANPQALESFADVVWKIAPLDILVNNAGADVLTGVAADWTFFEKLDALWKVDVQGTVLLARSIGSKMKERGSGTIINMGWSQVETGMAGDSGEYFAAVKGAVMGFSRSLAKSLAPEVRVNCVAPGWIQTQWAESASDYWQHRAVNESLVARWGMPDDVARVVRFLASPEAAFVNGQVLNIDGGSACSSDHRDWN